MTPSLPAKRSQDTPNSSESVLMRGSQPAVSRGVSSWYCPILQLSVMMQRESAKDEMEYPRNDAMDSLMCIGLHVAMEVLALNTKHVDRPILTGRINRLSWRFAPKCAYTWLDIIQIRFPISIVAIRDKGQGRLIRPRFWSVCSGALVLRPVRCQTCSNPSL